jgi:hypothetical protein
MKKIAIMQPYFLPYIGYFQLINTVNEFIIYDNIQFSKSGWIHRNRILENGKDVYISLPIKKDSDYLDVKDRVLADSFEKDKLKMIAKIKNNYREAPFFEYIMPLVETIFQSQDKNLFQFTFQSLKKVCEYLEIDTPFIVSSTINIDHTLKGEKKVKALLKERKGEVYINPIGGMELYEKVDFKKEGIDLLFIKTNDFTYRQFKNDFIPFLSIVDVMMFNNLSTIKNHLINYRLI